MTDVETRVTSAYDMPLQDGSVHRAFLVTVPSEIPEGHRALLALHRVLKTGGVLSVTREFLVPDYALARTTIGWGSHAGFALPEPHRDWFVWAFNHRNPV